MTGDAMNTIPKLYLYDPKTKELLGQRDAAARPCERGYILQATFATPVVPPDVPDGYVARWTGEVWKVVEDHRQHMDDRGRKEGGTPYWLPGDTWRSEPRYMDELGPLPENALLERPERPLGEYKADKRREIAAGYTAALTATLTMPAESPSAAEVATGAALFAVDDAEGLADVQTILIARRGELLAAVDAAANREELNEIVIEYPV